MENIEKFLENYYKKDEYVILACSTGPDSMYLLYKILKTKFAKNLVACYFNHKLRKEADEEEIFLKKLWKKLNFKVEIWDEDIKSTREKYYTNIWIEELSRKKRYEFFDAIMHIYKTNKVITAHHLDDKIETFFFNLTRGTKITGLVNMRTSPLTPLLKWEENKRIILRPLLKLQKKEILDYLDENNLEYKIDKTNFENNFSRNKLRNQIIPLFSEINSNYKSNISNFMDYLEEIKEMIDFEVKKFLEIPLLTLPLSEEEKNMEKIWKNSFEIEKFNFLSPFLQKEVIRYIFFIRNWNSTIWLSSANIWEVIKFINWKNNKTKKEIKNMKLFKDNKVIKY